MEELTLTIKWGANITEKLYLANVYDLSIGCEVITIETWKDTKEVMRYRARVENYLRIGQQLIIGLRYLEANNPDAVKNEAWGLSKITLLLAPALADSTGTVIWQDDRADKAHAPGAGTMSIRVDKDLISEDDVVLKHAILKVRKQTRFRRELLDIDPVCAITGETCRHVLDAAHIFEVKGLGGFGIGNGILLRSDIHRLFDARLLKINSEGRITLHRDALTASSYSDMAQQLNDDVLKRIRKNLEKRNRADIV